MPMVGLPVILEQRPALAVPLIERDASCLTALINVIGMIPSDSDVQNGC